MFFFFNDTATTEIYTLSLHDALPIYLSQQSKTWADTIKSGTTVKWPVDRKSTRLNSSHQIISYAVFCLKKPRQARRSVVKRGFAENPADAPRRQGRSRRQPRPVGYLH